MKGKLIHKSKNNWVVKFFHLSDQELPIHIEDYIKYTLDNTKNFYDRDGEDVEFDIFLTVDKNMTHHKYAKIVHPKSKWEKNISNMETAMNKLPQEDWDVFYQKIKNFNYGEINNSESIEETWDEIYEKGKWLTRDEFIDMLRKNYYPPRLKRLND